MPPKNTAKKKKQEEMAEEVKKIRRDPDNLICADCSVRSTPYICINYSSFICTECSGIHRKFNHRVKSIAVATFTEKEVENIRNGGNALLNRKYLAQYKKNQDPFSLPREGEKDKKERYIQLKYIDKKWYSYKQSNKKEQKRKYSSSSQEETESDTITESSSDEEESDSDSEEEDEEKPRHPMQLKQSYPDLFGVNNNNNNNNNGQQQHLYNGAPLKMVFDSNKGNGLEMSVGFQRQNNIPSMIMKCNNTSNGNITRIDIKFNKNYLGIQTAQTTALNGNILPGQSQTVYVNLELSQEPIPKNPLDLTVQIAARSMRSNTSKPTVTMFMTHIPAQIFFNNGSTEKSTFLSKWRSIPNTEDQTVTIQRYKNKDISIVKGILMNNQCSFVAERQIANRGVSLYYSTILRNLEILFEATVANNGVCRVVVKSKNKYLSYIVCQTVVKILNGDNYSNTTVPMERSDNVDVNDNNPQNNNNMNTLNTIKNTQNETQNDTMIASLLDRIERQNQVIQQLKQTNITLEQQKSHYMNAKETEIQIIKQERDQLKFAIDTMKNQQQANTTETQAMQPQNILEVEQLRADNNTMREKINRLEDEKKEYDITIRELKTKINELKVKTLNVNNFMKWDGNDVLNWIFSLNNGLFLKYQNKLSKEIIDLKIKGVDLLKVDRNDIKDFGVEIYSDQKILQTAINKLRQINYNRDNYDNINIKQQYDNNNIAQPAATYVAEGNHNVLVTGQ